MTHTEDALEVSSSHHESGSRSEPLLYNGLEVRDCRQALRCCLGDNWTIDVDTGNLHAFNATTGAQIFNYQLGPTIHFATISAGDGHTFALGDKRIFSFILG